MKIDKEKINESLKEYNRKQIIRQKKQHKHWKEESRQIELVKKRICPFCGSKIKERNILTVLSHMFSFGADFYKCTKCDYKAELDKFGGL